MTDIATSSIRAATLVWIKSSYSGGEGNECVEMAFRDTAAVIRDSKAPEHGTLSVTRSTFTAFVADLKR